MGEFLRIVGGNVMKLHHESHVLDFLKTQIDCQSV